MEFSSSLVQHRARHVDARKNSIVINVTFLIRSKDIFFTISTYMRLDIRHCRLAHLLVGTDAAGCLTTLYLLDKPFLNSTSACSVFGLFTVRSAKEEQWKLNLGLSEYLLKKCSATGVYERHRAAWMKAQDELILNSEPCLLQYQSKSSMKSLASQKIIHY